jgi:hypothetical protein
MKYQQPVGGAANDPYVTGVPGVTPGSIPPAAAIEHPQREILAVIEGEGLTPDAGDLTQLRQAILSMIAAGAVAPTDYIVRYATIGNVNLSGLGTQAGGDWPSALNDSDLILVQSNTAGAENGWYNAHAGAWTRATFADTSAEIKSGFLTQVTEGSALGDTIWMLTTDGVTTLGTTPLAFVRKDSQRELGIFPVDAYIAGNALIVTLDAGTPIDFRSATLSSGAVTTLINATELTITAPNGASFGQISGVKSRIALVVINDAGVERPALYNAAGGAHLKEDTLITSTAISAGSTAANVFYSPVAVATPSPFRLAGYVESIQATAGVWATPLGTVQGAGGQPWAVDSSSFLWLSGHNGYGTTNTTIFRFTSILENSGDAFIYSDSAANGGLITIVNGGLYIAKHESWPANSGKHGISRNSTELTTAIGSIAAVNRIAFGGSGAGYPDTVMIAQRLNAGDMIRAHGDASTDLQPTEARFSLIRVGD